MSHDQQPIIGLIIPILNAGPYLDRLLPAIAEQSLQPDHFVVMDSESTDDSAERFRAAGAEVITVLRSQFDHGGTRQAAANSLDACDLLIFLTQDALPASPNCFAEIVRAFEDETVGMAYGRQLPHDDATLIAAHARHFNYPATSHKITLQDREDFGFRSCFCSNSFAAYRRSALLACGGFPEGTLFAEDAIMASKMLLAGWSKVYQAEASVHHSHNYSIGEEFRRAFDIGAFHCLSDWILEEFGRVEGEGKRFVLSELRYLLRSAPWMIPSAVARTIAKYTGYKLGLGHQRLSKESCRRLSFNRRYWVG